MKFLLKHKWFVLIETAVIISTFIIHHYETIRRGYETFGGEFLLPGYAAILYLIFKTVKEFKEVY